MVISSALIALVVSLAAPARCNPIYEQPDNFTSAPFRPASQVYSDGGTATEGSGMAGGTPDAGTGATAPSYVPPNASGSKVIQLAQPRAAQTGGQEEEKKKPEMSAPQSGSGDKGSGSGSKGGGGGCKGACSKIAAAGSELDQAAAKMLPSGDPELVKIGGDVQALSGKVKSVNKDLSEASNQLSKAKSDLESASKDLKTFADANKTDVQKLKTMSEDMEKKGEKTKDCKPVAPGQVSEDPKRTAKFPTGAREQITSAEKALKAAEAKIKSAEATAKTIATDGPKINTALAATQKRLGSPPMPGLAVVIERAKRDVDNGVKIHKERLKELQDAWTATDAAETAAKEAEEASKAAEKAVETAKKAINTNDTPPLTAAEALYATGTDEAKKKACENAKTPAQTVKDAAKEPKQPVQQAVTKEPPATTKAGDAETAVGKVGQI